ncbi:MAG: glycosyltransferase family 4 protein [Anaerolinea sp.]|nr:glycosyltransferase family 4 protein [Anaerolinea sp.]
MRLGLIIYGRLTTISGGYLYDRKLVEYLQRAGDQVDVVSLPWTWYGRHLTHNLSPSLYRHLRAAPYDILLQDELNHPSLFWLNRRLRGHVPYPIVSIVHHLRSSEQRPAWQNRFYHYIERHYLASVDGFIYNSATTQQTVAAALHPSSLSLLPSLIAYPAGDQFQPTLSPTQISARAQEPGPLRILFVGNLIPRKNLRLLIAALARLPLPDWRLAVVGNTAVSHPYTRAIHRQIAQHNLAGNVTLHGALTNEQLAAQMQQSHLLAVPSSYEGFGIVYLEGMGFGLPAIAGVDGAAHELITSGVNGFLVANAADLAQQIRTLRHDRDRLAQMSLAAQQRYQAHPTWEATAVQVRRFLQNLKR